jgi:hypothetical protein
VDTQSATEARLQGCNYAQPKNNFDPPKSFGHNEVYRKTPEQLQERIRDASRHRFPNEKGNTRTCFETAAKIHFTHGESLMVRTDFE